MGRGKFVLKLVMLSEFRIKLAFAKGYTPTWSTEIFKVVNAADTKPVTYTLADCHGRPIFDGFYNEEIQKTEIP